MVKVKEEEGISLPKLSPSHHLHPLPSQKALTMEVGREEDPENQMTGPGTTMEDGTVKINEIKEQIVNSNLF
jgi:hypothetical protein